MKNLIVAVVAVALGLAVYFKVQNQVAGWKEDVEKNRSRVVTGFDELEAEGTREFFSYERVLRIQEEMTAADEALIDLLSHKPFGLALSQTELALKTSAKANRDQLAKSRAELIAERDKPEEPSAPAPTPQPGSWMWQDHGPFARH